MPRQRFWWLVVEKLPLAAIAAAAAAATLWTHAIDVRVPPRDLGARLANSVVAATSYLVHFFYPVDLAAFYPWPDEGYSLWQVAGAVSLLAAVSAAAIVWRRACPWLLVGWLWYLGMLVPVLGIVAIAAHAMADRYTYLAEIGLSISLAWGGAQAGGQLTRPAVGRGGGGRPGDCHPGGTG